MKNFRTIGDWEREKENIQNLLDKGEKHKDIGRVYNVSGSTIDLVIKRLGLVRHFEKFKISSSKININVSDIDNNVSSTLPVPIKYSLPVIFKIQILRYREDRKKYSTTWAYYIPEIGKWVKSTSGFNRCLKRLGITYDEWECKWILKLPIEKLYSIEWIEKVVEYRFRDKPINTRIYIKSEFKKGNFVTSKDIFLVKSDLIKLYLDSRLNSLYKVNYDFSKVPEVLKSPRETFTLLVNEVGEIKSYYGEYNTNYFSLVVEKKDIKELIGNKLNLIRSMGKHEFIEKAKQIHGNNRYDYSKVNYINNRESVVIIDTKLDIEFETTPDRFLQGYGNPADRESMGEQFIRTYLKETLNISPKSQVRIKDKIKGRKTNLIIIDFIINYNGVEYWIEYNGIQHYKDTKYFHQIGDYSFGEQIKRDENLRGYCIDNGIVLLEVPYILDTYFKISKFLDSTILHKVDPNTLIDYKSLYK